MYVWRLGTALLILAATQGRAAFASPSQTSVPVTRQVAALSLAASNSVAIFQVRSTVRPQEGVYDAIRARNPGADTERTVRKLGAAFTLLRPLRGFAPRTIILEFQQPDPAAPRSSAQRWTNPALHYLRTGEIWLVGFRTGATRLDLRSADQACRLASLNDPFAAAYAAYVRWLEQEDSAAAETEAVTVLQSQRSSESERIAALEFVERQIGVESGAPRCQRLRAAEQAALAELTSNRASSGEFLRHVLRNIRLTAFPPDPLPRALLNRSARACLQAFERTSDPGLARELAVRLAAFATEELPDSGKLRVMYYPEIISAIERRAAADPSFAEAARLNGPLQSLESRGLLRESAIRQPYTVMRLTQGAE